MQENMEKIMMRTKTFIITGQPVPLARARCSRWRGVVYDSQKQNKLVIGLQLMEQAANMEPFTKATELDITFFMKPPQKRKENGGWCVTRPDCSNLLKMYEDVLQDCRVLQDDSIIAKIIARKIYDTKPRTVIVLTEL